MIEQQHQQHSKTCQQPQSKIPRTNLTPHQVYPTTEIKSFSTPTNHNIIIPRGSKPSSEICSHAPIVDNHRRIHLPSTDHLKSKVSLGRAAKPAHMLRLWVIQQETREAFSSSQSVGSILAHTVPSLCIATSAKELGASVRKPSLKDFRKGLQKHQNALRSSWVLDLKRSSTTKVSPRCPHHHRKTLGLERIHMWVNFPLVTLKSRWGKADGRSGISIREAKGELRSSRKTSFRKAQCRKSWISCTSQTTTTAFHKREVLLQALLRIVRAPENGSPEACSVPDLDGRSLRQQHTW